MDDALGSTWGYTDGMTVRPAESVVRELMELSSMGGNLLLNVSPMGDGSIPEVQQKALLAVGEWLKVNGEGIYGSRPWVRMGEGPMLPAEAPGDWKGGSTAVEGPKIARAVMPKASEADFRFTVAKDAVWAWGYVRPVGEARIVSMASGRAKVERVTAAGSGEGLKFRQAAEGLFVSVPPGSAGMPYGLKIEGNMPLGAM